MNLEELEEKYLDNCLSCEKPYVKNSIRCYTHKGGIDVEGFEKKQWVYAHCYYCEMDTALWKLIRNGRIRDTARSG